MLSRVLSKWLLVLGSIGAGLVPMVVVVVVDLTMPHHGAARPLLTVFGPPLGPLVVSLAFVPHLRWRALWIALGGYLVELVIVIAFLAAMPGENWS